MDWINKTWIDSVSLLPETPFVFSVLFNDQELLFAMNYSKAEIFYRENESNLNHQLQNESKNQDTRTVFIVSHFADEFSSVSYVCWKFVPVLIFTVKTLQTSQKSTLNFMLHWLGNYPQLHVQLSQVKRIPLD